MIHDNRVFVKAFGGGIYRRAEAVLNAIRKSCPSKKGEAPSLMTSTCRGSRDNQS